MHNMQDILTAGTIIQGRYIIQNLLGNGGFGAIYQVMDRYAADQRNLHFLVLKEVIHPHKHELYQMVLESMALRLLDHQALPRVYNVIGSHKPDRVYVLMDYIEGWNLRRLQVGQVEKALPFPLVMTIMQPVLDAVSYMHNRQPALFHQDIKPINIILRKGDRRPGKVVLVDFGIGKKYHLDIARTGLRLLLTGYEAPEQCSGEASVRTDIYGLGATFYTLLTGFIPPDALYRKNQVESRRGDPLEPVDRLAPKISTQVAVTIKRAMSLNADDRFHTVAHFEQELKADPSWQKSPKLDLQHLAHGMYLALNADRVQQPFVANIAPSTPAIEEPPEHEAVSSTPVEEEVTIAHVVQSAPLDVESPVTHIILPVPVDEDITLAQAVEASPVPVPSEPAEASSTTASAAGQSQIKSSRKQAVLLPVAMSLFALGVALLIGIIIGASFLAYTISHSSHPATSAPTRLHKNTPVSNATATVTPISTRPVGQGAYPGMASSYSGTIYDVSAGTSTIMSLSSIQQNLGNFSGHFTGLATNGSFTGNITPGGHIHFSLVDATGRVTVAFDGEMQPDGNLSGNYCDLNQQGQCSGGYGVWSVVPVV